MKEELILDFYTASDIRTITVFLLNHSKGIESVYFHFCNVICQKNLSHRIWLSLHYRIIYGIAFSTNDCLFSPELESLVLGRKM